MNDGNYRSVAGIVLIFGKVISVASATEASAPAPALPALYADPHRLSWNP